jgi:LPS export ABC transporter protein LptC
MSIMATGKRERLARAGLLSIMLIVLATLMIFILQGPARRIPSMSVAVIPQSPSSGLREFSFVESKAGDVEWKIRAQQAQVFDADAKAVLSGVRLTMADSKGVQMTVEGDDGTINTTSKDFVLSNRSSELAIVFNDGFTIYTSRVTWVNDERRLWTDAPVRITGPSIEVTGEGMDALLATQEMRIRRDARVEVY